MSKFGELIDAQVPVLIDFFTEWHEQSITMNETIRHVAAALGDKAKVIKIDVDKNQELAAKYQVRGVPTMILYQNGKQLWRQSGVLSKDEIIKVILEKSN